MFGDVDAARIEAWVFGLAIPLVLYVVKRLRGNTKRQQLVQESRIQQIVERIDHGEGRIDHLQADVSEARLAQAKHDLEHVKKGL